MAGAPVVQEANALGQSRENALGLWETAEKLLGEKFVVA